MNQHTKQRGSILLIAIALIVGVSLLAVAFTSLYIGDTASSADHATASQALFVAESGLSNALENFRTGTACAALNLNNVAFGNGTFTTIGTLFQPAATTTTAAITALSTVIPVSSTAGYAPHGRVTIQTEQIDYATIVGNTFTGARRGVNGTTAAAHANGQAVTQNQCLVRSTGTVGASRRVVEAGVAPAVGTTRSDFVGGGSVNINTPVVSLASLSSPAFTLGTNVILAAVSLENTTVTSAAQQVPNIAGGNLRLRRGATNVATNPYVLPVGQTSAVSPSATNFSRESAFLLGRQINVPASPNYYVDARANTNNVIRGEAKMVVINNPPSSDLRTGANNNVAVGGTNLLNNQQFTVPAGDRAIIAVVDLYNNIGNAVGATRTIPAGALQLRKGNAGGPVLVQNEFQIDLASQKTNNPNRQFTANRHASILLVARDPNGVNNQRYTLRAAVAAYGGGASNLRASARVVVLGISGSVSAAVLDARSVAVGPIETVIASLPTTFAGGEQVVIGALQYQNGSAATHSIAAAGERLVVNGVQQSVSQYGLGLCNTATSVVCDDFGSGLLWRTQSGSASPTFDLRAQASGASISAEGKLLTIQMTSGVTVIDWLEVVQ